MKPSLLQTPRRRDRRERRPLVPLGQARRAVATDHAGQEVLVREAVVRAREERDELALVVVRARRRRPACVPAPRLLHLNASVMKFCALDLEAEVVELAVLVTADDLELVPLDRAAALYVRSCWKFMFCEIALGLTREAAERRAERAALREVRPRTALVKSTPNVVCAVRVGRNVKSPVTLPRTRLSGAWSVDLLRDGDRVAHALRPRADLVEPLLARGRVGHRDRLRRVEDRHVREHAARRSRRCSRRRCSRCSRATRSC